MIIVSYTMTGTSVEGPSKFTPLSSAIFSTRTHDLTGPPSLPFPVDAKISSSSSTSNAPTATGSEKAAQSAAENAERVARPTKKRSLLLSRSRSTSRITRHAQTGESSNTDTGVAAKLLSSNPSKKKRANSNTSSRRRFHEQPAENSGSKTLTPDADDSTKAEKSSKAPSSKFLSFLSCCSSQCHDDHDTPPKRSSLKPVPARQSAPIEKNEHTTTDSGPPQLKPVDLGEKEPINFLDPNQAGEPSLDSDHGEEASNDQELTAQPSPETSKDAQDSLIPEQKLPAPAPVGASSSADEKKPVSDDYPLPESHTPPEKDITMPDPADDNYPDSDESVEVLEDTVANGNNPSFPSLDLHQQIATSPQPEKPSWLLPEPLPHLKNRKCLVLDLDETLVHSSFKVFFLCIILLFFCSHCAQVLDKADFTIPVEIEGQYHNIYVIKRPGVDQFMKRVGELYEIVVFTASVSKVCTTDSRSQHG